MGVQKQLEKNWFNIDAFYQIRPYSCCVGELVLKRVSYLISSWHSKISWHLRIDYITFPCTPFLLHELRFDTSLLR